MNFFYSLAILTICCNASFLACMQEQHEPTHEKTEANSEQYAQPRPLRPPNAYTYQQNHFRALRYLEEQKKSGSKTHK
jgi:hypothetical protein